MRINSNLLYLKLIACVKISIRSNMSGRLLCILIFCVYLNGSHADGRTLYVGALFELSNHWYAKYINFFITILEHAFDEIDNRTDILADYSLKLITKDTQVCLVEDHVLIITVTTIII